MDRQTPTLSQRVIAGYILLAFLLSGCTQPATFCPAQLLGDLTGALAYAANDQLNFQFPLDELGRDTHPDPAVFCSSGGSGSACEYHAAEDYHLPGGTPVYAIADGTVSFSGPMGGLRMVGHHRPPRG